MGFKFSFLCDLLSSLEDNRIIKASTASRNRNPDTRVISRWFAQHEKRLHDKTTDPLAFLSSLFPEKRTDRVYWLQDASLARVIGRCLLLGSSRREELDSWRVSGGVDLGQCVENVMRQAENHILNGQEVTVEEIDSALNRIASRCKFSGPWVRRQHAAVDVDEALAPLYRRLSSRDAKWLTRMILKSYSPVVMPMVFVLRRFHFLLPRLLLFQDSFDAALSMLASEPIRHFPPHPESELAKNLGTIAVQHLSPVVGVKIGRPEYYKARSIEHCCQMVGRRRMSLERKYDGEYCQIHIDLSNAASSIQIFSKSGKDSTTDRAGIHQVLRDTLRIGERDCSFSRRCILEGELLVWSDKHGKILDFHKLRKFISRSGIFIGTENDSPPQPYEHLMIVLFDVLLIDDNICLRKPHRERRLLLKNMIRVIPGRSDIAEQEILDFSRPDSQYKLERSFSKSITERWEGYVLKGCDEPYFPMFSTEETGSPGCWIKLKKDYIPGLGDTVDLAIIGGRYDARNAAAMNDIRRLSWTHFMVGCLVNKEAVLQLSAKPIFRIVDMVSRYSMSRQNMQILNQFGEFSAYSRESNHGFDIEQGQANLPYMGTVFKTPFVVEMMGSGFEKPSGTRHFTLRFPRLLKIHSDRTFEEAASFSELQLLADAARSAPTEDLSQEENRWSKRLRLDNGSVQYIADRSQSTSCTTNSSFEHTSSGSFSPIKTLKSIDHRVTDSKHGYSHEQHSQHMELTDHAQLRDRGTKGSSNPIPIYVDLTEGPRAGSEASGLDTKVLTENENLSQPQTKKMYPAEEQLSKLNYRGATEDSVGADRANLSNLINFSITSRTKPRPRKLVRGKASNGTSSTKKTSLENQQMHLRSPLSAIPIYLPPAVSQTETQESTTLTKDTQATANLSTFLSKLTSNVYKEKLEQSNPTATSQNTALGLVCINNIENSLGTQIVEIGKAIKATLKAPITNFPRRGKLFILDSEFLELRINASDQQFCLRKTWESIAEVYFCACLTWDSNVEIGFDKRELGALGEFHSLEPVIHSCGSQL